MEGTSGAGETLHSIRANKLDCQATAITPLAGLYPVRLKLGNRCLKKRRKTGKTKAIEHYEKFLDLWKDADPGIAEIEVARKSVAGLKVLVNFKID